MEKHAISFRMINLKDEFYCYMEIEGKIKHEDYEFFVPVFENAIKDIKDVHIKLLVDITKIEGWELHAAWDDLKFGLKHGTEFSKIALIGNDKLYEYGTKVTNWFTPGAMKYFDNKEDAKNWLEEK